MREYVKLHIARILITVLAISLFVLVIWLDGYRNYLVIGYGLLLFCLLLLFVSLAEYLSNAAFYHYLKSGKAVRGSNGSLSKKWRKQFDAREQQMQEKLTELNQHHQNHIRFMNIWVHQMKTPVSVLALMAESEKVDSYDLLAETDRLKSGLATALNFVRLEDFTEDFVIESVSLLEVVKHGIGEQKRNFIRSDVYPKLLSDADITVTTDKKWLGILLFQLISNAIKYSKPESKVCFEIDPFSRSLTISDEGCGIAEADLPRVFRPFYTGQNGRQTGEATGIGLYLVETISKQLDIDIALVSKENLGTTVTLTFRT